VVATLSADHPDAGKAGINVMFEFTPAGETIKVTRH
jgi:hypothetical protein